MPGSSLYSTVDDVAWVMGLLMTVPGKEGSSILSSASLREIQTVQAETGRRRRGYVDRGYGLGVLIMERPSGVRGFGCCNTTPSSWQVLPGSERERAHTRFWGVVFSLAPFQCPLKRVNGP